MFPDRCQIWPDATPVSCSSRGRTTHWDNNVEQDHGSVIICHQRVKIQKLSLLNGGSDCVDASGFNEK